MGSPYVYVMMTSRIKTIELVNNYWTAPMTAVEEEDIRGRLNFRRSMDRCTV